MRQLCIIFIGFLIIAVEVLLGVRTFFPDALASNNDSIDEIIEKKKSIMQKMSPEDIAWAANNDAITVGVDPNFYPLEMFDERGKYTGLGGDYLRLLAKMTGLNFKPVKASDWAAVEDAAKDGKIDVFMAAAKTGRRSDYMLFTPPYITMPGVIMTRNDSGLDSVDISALEDKKVTVVKDYAWHDFLKEFHPEISVVPAMNTLDALQKVVSGEADAVLDYEFNLLEKIQTGGILQMQNAGIVNSSYGHSIAVQKSKPELFSLVSTALAQITPEEQKILADKWLNQDKPAGEERHLQWIFFFIVQAVLLCMCVNFFINYQTKKMVLSTLNFLCNKLEYKKI